MLSMARSKNRRKKSTRSKKSPSKPRQHVASSISAPEQTHASIESDEMCTTDYDDANSGSGAMIRMRGLISGAQPAKEGFFSRRRTLGEWGLWLVGLIGVYYAVRYFMGE
jgi:hypothetical protein